MRPMLKGSSKKSLHNYIIKTMDEPKASTSSTLDGMQRSIGGFLYQSKLLMMILYRGVNRKCSFLINTEWKNAEKFEDVIYKFKHEENWVWYFIQAKQRQGKNQGAEITKDMLIKDDNGLFDIFKYYKSYTYIVENDIFNNAKKFYIIWTNRILHDSIKCWFNTVGNDDRALLKTLQTEGELLKLSETGRREIRRALENNTDIKILAKALSELVLNPNKRMGNQVDIFKKYDSFLLDNIVNKTTGKFKNEFFDNENYHEFRDLFLNFIQCKTGGENMQKLSSYLETNNSEFTSEYWSNNYKHLKNLNEKKKLNIMANFMPSSIYEFDHLKFSEDIDFDDFFDHFIFAVNQPGTYEMDKLISEELDQNIILQGLSRDVKFNECVRKVIEWIQTKGDDFLSDEMVKNHLIEFKLRTLTTQQKFRLTKYNLLFEQNALNSLNLNLNRPQVYCIYNSYSTIFSLIKIFQIIDDTCDPYYILQSDKVLELKNFITCYIIKNPIGLFVLELDNCNTRALSDIYEWIGNIPILEYNIQIILITLKSITIKNFNVPFQSHITNINDDHNNFSDLTLASKEMFLQSSKIDFYGKEYPLTKLINRDKIETAINTDIFLKLFTHKKIVIGDSCSQLANNSYIIRNCRRLVVMDINMKTNHEDFIVTYCAQDLGKIDNKDILIVTRKETDFIKICEIYHQDVNIHWVKEKYNFLVWKQSRGTLQKIRRYAISDVSKTYPIDAIENLKDDFVIVSGKAGTGKSTLFTRLYHNMIISSSEVFLWPIKVNLVDYSSTFYTLNEENISEQKVKEILYTSLCLPDDLFTEQLFTFCYENDQMCAMLDGFDEIIPDHTKPALQMLKILKLRVNKLWISSRPYSFSETLEEALSTISYELQPYCNEEIETYLRTYWRNALVEFNNKIFDGFFKEILSHFENSTGDLQWEFLEIPLQTYMIAKVFRTLFQRVCQANETQLSIEIKSEIKDKFNVLRLYESFIDVKFEKISIAYQGTKFLQRQWKPEQTKLMYKFMILALNELFSPEDIRKLFNNNISQFHKTMSTFNPETEEIGIIDRVINGIPRFIHRTFAEFFAAKWFCNNLNNKSVKEFLIINGFETRFKIIWNFLNCLMTSDDTNKSDEWYTHNLVLSNNYEELGKLMNSADIFNLMEQRDKGGRTLLHLTAFAEDPVAKIILEALGDQSEDIINLKDEMFEMSALGYAMRLNNWEISDLLLEYKANSLDATHYVQNLSQQQLLVLFVNKGYLQLLKTIQKDYLISYKAILHIAIENANSKTIDILDYLINNGVNINNKREYNKETALHVAAARGISDCVNILIAKEIDINALDNEGRTALHHSFSNKHFNVATILIEKGADIGIRDKNGQTVIDNPDFNPIFKFVNFLKQNKIC